MTHHRMSEMNGKIRLKLQKVLSLPDDTGEAFIAVLLRERLQDVWPTR